MKSFKQVIKRFLTGTDASLTVEAALIMPLLAAFWVGSFVFYDGHKNRNTAMKASYLIGDIISRRETWITPTYLGELHEMFDALSFSGGSSAMRVTAVTWNGKKHRVQWSHSTSSVVPKHDNTTVRSSSFRDIMPLLAFGESTTIVETFQDYNPPFNIGWEPMVFQNFVVTSHRTGICNVFKDGDFESSC